MRNADCLDAGRKVRPVLYKADSEQLGGCWTPEAGCRGGSEKAQMRREHGSDEQTDESDSRVSL